MDEVLEEGVGARVADDRRGGVEVVVVEHHERLGLLRDQAEHGVGDVAVDDRVAVGPGVGLLLADVRRVREVPEVVLDEPEDRVRDDVVEAVVGHRLRLDHEHVVGGVVDRDLHRVAAGLPATATSSSVIAEATQSASRRATSPVSAVTSASEQ